jgi:hypothetical protein
MGKAGDLTCELCGDTYPWFQTIGLLGAPEAVAQHVYYWHDD